MKRRIANKPKSGVDKIANWPTGESTNSELASWVVCKSAHSVGISEQAGQQKVPRGIKVLKSHTVPIIRSIAASTWYLLHTQLDRDPSR